MAAHARSADEVFADALGGVGLAVRLIDERVRGPLDPLGPDNPIVLAAGPFASTPVPAANKHALATISPLTGLLNEGSVVESLLGGAAALRLAAIVDHRRARARGRRSSIDGDEVRVRGRVGARRAFGARATKALREAYGDRSLRVCAIGVAGERGVRYAAVENDGRQAGRGGTGAVFGAKRLKAVALRGRGEVAIADAAATAALAATLRARALGPKTAKYRVLGTAANLRVLQRMGQLPTRNFTAATFAGAENVTPERARESSGTYLELRAGCAGCPVQCEHLYVRKDRDRRSAAASEYESVWAFGPNCGVDDLDAVLDAIGRCDVLGLDTISTGSAIAFAMECAEHGSGAARRVRPCAAVRQRRRAAAGDRRDRRAARPGRRAGRRRARRRAAHRRRRRALRDALQRPRAAGLRAARAADLRARAWRRARAARATTARRPTTASCATPAPIADDALRARDALDDEDRAIAWDSLVLCKFVRDCFEDFETEGAALWTRGHRRPARRARTCRAVAQRTWERKRAINARLGWTPADDTLPERLFAEPIADGPHAGRRIEPERLDALRASYEAWRRAAGTPASVG